MEFGRAEELEEGPMTEAAPEAARDAKEGSFSMAIRTSSAKASPCCNLATSSSLPGFECCGCAIDLYLLLLVCVVIIVKEEEDVKDAWRGRPEVEVVEQTVLVVCWRGHPRCEVILGCMVNDWNVEQSRY